MPWNPLATGAAVIVRVITTPLIVTRAAGALGLGVTGLFAGNSFLIAAKTGAGVIAALQAIGAPGLSVIGTAIASITGGVPAGVITAIAMKEDSYEPLQPAIANPTDVKENGDLIY